MSVGLANMSSPNFFGALLEFGHSEYVPGVDEIEWCRHVYEQSHKVMVHNTHVWELATFSAVACCVIAFLCWLSMKKQRDEANKRVQFP